MFERTKVQVAMAIDTLDFNQVAPAESGSVAGAGLSGFLISAFT